MELVPSLPSSQEGRLQDIPQIPPIEMTSLALAPVERKGAMNIQEGKDELEEEELQELLSKLTDACTPEAPSGKILTITRDCDGQGVRLPFKTLESIILAQQLQFI